MKYMINYKTIDGEIHTEFSNEIKYNEQGMIELQLEDDITLTLPVSDVNIFFDQQGRFGVEED